MGLMQKTPIYEGIVIAREIPLFEIINDSDINGCANKLHMMKARAHHVAKNLTWDSTVREYISGNLLEIDKNFSLQTDNKLPIDVTFNRYAAAVKGMSFGLALESDLVSPWVNGYPEYAWHCARQALTEEGGVAIHFVSTGFKHTTGIILSERLGEYKGIPLIHGSDGNELEYELDGKILSSEQVALYTVQWYRNPGQRNDEIFRRIKATGRMAVLDVAAEVDKHNLSLLYSQAHPDLAHIPPNKHFTTGDSGGDVGMTFAAAGMGAPAVAVNAKEKFIEELLRIKRDIPVIGRNFHIVGSKKEGANWLDVAPIMGIDMNVAEGWGRFYRADVSDTVAVVEFRKGSSEDPSTAVYHINFGAGGTTVRAERRTSDGLEDNIAETPVNLDQRVLEQRLNEEMHEGHSTETYFRTLFEKQAA